VGLMSPTEHASFTDDTGAQKQHPSLSSLLREPIFVMQTADHGSLYNPVPARRNRCLCSLGGMRSEMGSGRPGPNAACGLPRL
jgi:hypothetical protein